MFALAGIFMGCSTILTIYVQRSAENALHEDTDNKK